MKYYDYNVYIRFSKLKKIQVVAETKKEAEDMVRDMLNNTDIFKLNMPTLSRNYEICQVKKIRRKK